MGTFQGRTSRSKKQMLIIPDSNFVRTRKLTMSGVYREPKTGRRVSQIILT